MAKLEDLCLRQTCERRPDLERAVKPELHECPEKRKELRPTIGERVSLQGSEGDVLDMMERAPHAGLGQQQEVAARQVHGAVGRGLVGRVLAGHAPMRSVDVGDRKVEHDQRTWSEVGRKCVQEPSKMRLFSCLPCEAEADVERLHGPTLAAQVGDQDGAVDPAACEHGEGGRPIMPGLGRRNPMCMSLAPRSGTDRAATVGVGPRSSGRAPRWLGFRARRSR